MCETVAAAIKSQTEYQRAPTGVVSINKRKRISNRRESRDSSKSNDDGGEKSSSDYSSGEEFVENEK
jgi:hypothetical protein